MVESSIVTYYKRIIDYSIGTAGSVEFNFERIWKTVKKLDHYNPNYLTFWHVHPEEFSCLSETDRNCAMGLCIGFGLKTLQFNLVLFPDNDILSAYTSFSLSSHLFNRRTQTFTDLQMNEMPDLDKIFFLKFLSYSC